MKTFHRATALVATALLATSLAACSHSNPSNDKESASAQATDSASTGKATQGDQQTTVAAQPAEAREDGSGTERSRASCAISTSSWRRAA